jgi:hypothetical protein
MDRHGSPLYCRFTVSVERKYEVGPTALYNDKIRRISQINQLTLEMRLTSDVSRTVILQAIVMPFSFLLCEILRCTRKTGSY